MEGDDAVGCLDGHPQTIEKLKDQALGGDVDVLFGNREGKFEKPFCREIFKSLPLLGRNCFHTAASGLRSRSCG